MATLPIYDPQKQKVGEINVSDDIFGVTPKTGVIHEVVVWQMAKKRAGTASTKTRREVRGGGRKPWRQKGTGRARAGSNASPLWKGGGTVFGPKPRSYAYTLPKKVRKLGLRMVLSDKVLSERLFVIKDFGLKEIKTKEMAALLDRFGAGKAVIAVRDKDRVLELSARNIPNVKVLPQDGLNVYDLLKHEFLLIHEPAVEAIEERLKP